MKLLKNKRCYLSAPIENALGLDRSWRDKVSNYLKTKFEIDLFDPFFDPKQQKAEQLVEARKEKNHNLIMEIAKSFVRKDLAMVDRSDFLIAYLPGVKTTGTHHEIINASNSKKPVLLVCDQPDKYELPLWYYGFIPFEFMFSSWDELFVYLHKVDDGLKTDNPKWDFINGLL